MPTKVPCLAKWISAGLWVDLEASWALARGMPPLLLLANGVAMLVVVIVGTLRLVAPLLLLLFFVARFSLTGGLLLILLSGPSLTVVGGRVGSLSRCNALPFGLLLGCLLSIRVGVQVGGGSEGLDAVWLDESLDANDVYRAWLVWSGAAEAALSDAHQFCGGPIPTRGLVFGRESALFRVVRLAGRGVGAQGEESSR